MKFLVTGGAGFIGSAMIRYLINNTENSVLNLDKLTYAGNLDSLISISSNNNYKFIQGDISNKKTTTDILSSFQPDIIMNLAAESHVDRSIDSSEDFISTNILGTFNLLNASLDYWNNLKGEKKNTFRYHQISTDEVYGSLGKDGQFTELSPYNPNSPYSASKASADHLVKAWHKTYDLPILLTNCSNNYGPYQFPEKLIPLMIHNAIKKKELPIYGNGKNIRDWIHVDDHVEALYKVILNGEIGNTYNIGGNCEKSNLQVVNLICEYFDKMNPLNVSKLNSYKDLIIFVKDRPGHDMRYSVSNSKITKDLGWSPKIKFTNGLKMTIDWYMDNTKWYKNILDKSYKKRLGLSRK